MQPAKSWSTSNTTLLQSVTNESSARTSGEMAPAETESFNRSSILAAPRVHTLQWPSSPPWKRSVTSRLPVRTTIGVTRSATMWSSFPVYSVMRSSAWALAMPKPTSSVR